MTGLFLPLDVEYASDDEFIDAGPYAELLYIRACCFIKRKSLDGHLRRSQLATVAGNIPAAKKHVQRLVEVGLFVEEPDGWYLPAYLKRNPSKADIDAGRDMAKEAGIRGNHERWHVGESGKPSPKCPLCRADRIGSRIAPPIAPPMGGSSRVGSPTTETEPEPEEEPEPEPLPEPMSSSSTAGSKLALVKPTDDDDFAATVERIVDARCQGRRITNARAYRATVSREARELDGELIRRMLDDGDPPDQVAAFVLGNGFATEAERAKSTVPWCGPECETCGGDAWVEVNDGLAPCPNRSAETA